MKSTIEQKNSIRFHYLAYAIYLLIINLFLFFFVNNNHKFSLVISTLIMGIAIFEELRSLLQFAIAFLAKGDQVIVVEKIIMDSMKFQSETPLFLLEPLIIIGGAICGTIWYWIGIRWYIIRLKLCGIDAPNQVAARNIYIYSDLIINLPVAFVVIIYPILLRITILTLPAMFVFGHVIIYILVIWSSFVSYKTIKENFGAGNIRAKMLFFVLPIVLAFIVNKVAS